MRVAIASLSAFLMLGLAGNAPALEQTQQPISQAETLLFMTKHLAAIRKDAALKYQVVKAGSLEDPFEDQVALAVSVDKDGSRLVTPQFASGKQREGYGPVPAAESNPVILYFLESDVKEMKRLTGGSDYYFRKRIRMALAENAEVRPVEFRFQDKAVKGTEIRIKPYAGDPLAKEKGKEKYAPLLGKYYVFTLSDAVPGGVYQMKAVIPELAPAGGAAAKTLLEDTVTLVRFDG